MSQEEAPESHLNHSNTEPKLKALPPIDLSLLTGELDPPAVGQFLAKETFYVSAPEVPQPRVAAAPIQTKIIWTYEIS